MRPKKTSAFLFRPGRKESAAKGKKKRKIEKRLAAAAAGRVKRTTNRGIKESKKKNADRLRQRNMEAAKCTTYSWYKIARCKISRCTKRTTIVGIKTPPADFGKRKKRKNEPRKGGAFSANKKTEKQKNEPL